MGTIMLTFAVLGDIHYVKTSSHKKVLNGDKNSSAREDIKRYLRMKKEIIP